MLLLLFRYYSDLFEIIIRGIEEKKRGGSRTCLGKVGIRRHTITS